MCSIPIQSIFFLIKEERFDSENQSQTVRFTSLIKIRPICTGLLRSDWPVWSDFNDHGFHHSLIIHVK